MLHKITLTGGVLTESDFADYQVIVKPALQGSFKNRTVYTSHAPTSGPVLLFMLNLYEQFDKTTDYILFLHRYIEILKCKRLNHFFSITNVSYSTFFLKLDSVLGQDFFVFKPVSGIKYSTIRTRIADPAFVNSTDLLDQVPTKAYANEIFGNITDVCPSIPFNPSL